MSPCGIALVLALDVSGSIDDAQWQIQRDGHAAALRAPEIARIVEREGLALAVIQFDEDAHPVMGWRVLRTAQDAAGASEALSGMWRRGGMGWTAPGEALGAALALLDAAPCGEREIIDVVTDAGRANQGPPLAPIREALTMRGVAVNALVVEASAEWTRENLVTPGGFAMEVAGWEQFPAAIRRKLVLELGAVAR